MKKLLAILLATVMTLSALCFVGCDKGDNKTDGTLEFKYSDYYKQALNFEEFKPYLEQFLTLVKKAYDASDKKTFSTFKLDAAYDGVLKNLNTALQKPIDADANEVDAFLKASEARMKVDTMVNEVLAVIATWSVNTPETVDESLFKKMNDSLNKIMNELANGNG